MPSNKHVTRESFLVDVKTHEMEVALDQGAYRHLLFKRPNTITLSFTLTTTPGRLVYGGDMGCYVFERLPDMFQFFRRGKDREPNFDYWHEKLQAVDRVSGSETHSVHKFRENLESYIDHDTLSGAEVGRVREFIDEVCEQFENDSPELARRQVFDFDLDGSQVFTDFWELNDKEFSLRYQWACYAIQWGINKYDQYKEPKDAK